MNFENKIIIFDDFIDKEYQEKIKRELLGSEDNMILVIDDFIDKEYQEKIKNTLIGGTDNKNKHHESEFPWYFIEDVTASGDDGNQKLSLIHI